ncbi:hypothetical protein HPB51_011652 [Rhipicephalus microplus]|uniref:Tick transposon n=1 Tax=Rhipicephalus microplus TaxID=6941 RepID=A0A9J6ETI2_RHIMP|nr:hypothetical protein HPB51_011652 [Rhipicephalus microplus]
MAASEKNSRAEQAEEVAIALAVANTACHTVLSYSRQAARNFAKGQICREAERILSAAKLQDRQIGIKWSPAHVGDMSERNDNHNETAHTAARALTDRARRQTVQRGSKPRTTRQTTTSSRKPTAWLAGLYHSRTRGWVERRRYY